MMTTSTVSLEQRARACSTGTGCQDSRSSDTRTDAMGVPGTLKNAIDWTVSSMEFSHKPVALITASSVGQKAHLSLLETLKVIESDIPETSQLLVSFVKTKINNDKIIDPATLSQVKNLVDSLILTIDNKQNGARIFIGVYPKTFWRILSKGLR